MVQRLVQRVFEIWAVVTSLRGVPGSPEPCNSNNSNSNALLTALPPTVLSACYPCALQAILPLRGKILNVERKDDAALYKNQEIAALIVALGLGTKGGSNGSSGGKKGRSKAGSPRSSSSVDPRGSMDEGEVAAGDGSVDVLKGLRCVREWVRVSERK